MVTALTLVVLSQLSAPPLVPLDTPADESPVDVGPPPPPPPLPPTLGTAPREARLLPADPAPSTAALIGRAALAPMLVLGIGVLLVPLSLYLGALIGVALDPFQGGLGGGVGAIAGAALSFFFGTAVASTLFSRDQSGFRRSMPWAIGGAVLSTIGVCLMVFVPAVGIAALPFVVGGTIVLAAAVPLVTELARPKGPDASMPVASF